MLTYARLWRAWRVVSSKALVQAVLAADFAAPDTVALEQNVVVAQWMAPSAECLRSGDLAGLTTMGKVGAVLGADDGGNVCHRLTSIERRFGRVS
jgi:hypothetical protein